MRQYIGSTWAIKNSDGYYWFKFPPREINNCDDTFWMKYISAARLFASKNDALDVIFDEQLLGCVVIEVKHYIGGYEPNKL